MKRFIEFLEDLERENREVEEDRPARRVFNDGKKTSQHGGGSTEQREGAAEKTPVFADTVARGLTEDGGGAGAAPGGGAGAGGTGPAPAVGGDVAPSVPHGPDGSPSGVLGPGNVVVPCVINGNAEAGSSSRSARYYHRRFPRFRRLNVTGGAAGAGRKERKPKNPYTEN